MASKDGKIIFDTLKYLTLTDEIANKRLKDREIVIIKNTSLFYKKFAIKYENKYFYVTGDYKTCTDKELTSFVEKHKENLTNLADYFKDNTFQVFGCVTKQGFFCHSIKINTLYLDYEDAAKLFIDYGFPMDETIYSGVYNKEVVDEFSKSLDSLAIIPMVQGMDERDDFYVLCARHVKESAREKDYTESINKFFDSINKEDFKTFTREYLIKMKQVYVVTEYNFDSVYLSLMQYVFDVYKIEIKNLVRENKLLLSFFNEKFRSLLKDFLKSTLIG